MAARAGERYQPALRAITIRRSTHERDVCGQELRDDVRVERRGSGQVCYPPAVVHEHRPAHGRVRPASAAPIPAPSTGESDLPSVCEQDEHAQDERIPRQLRQRNDRKKYEYVVSGRWRAHDRDDTGRGMHAHKADSNSYSS